MDWCCNIPPWVAALPWIIASLVVMLRLRDSRTLAEYPPPDDAGGPHVSVILPARNEARNIERCVRSLLATDYRRVELIVVDDHSSDGTGAMARALVAGDSRARVTTPPPLPDGWFGKQWACAHGASLATGELLLFTDADTEHAPDLLPRSVQALRTRGADLLSVVGRQELGSFWEKVVQPAMFIGMFALFGGTEAVSRSRRPRRKIANGQYMLMRRDTYDALGGHEAVRAYSAEDLMLAQTWTAAGRAVHLVGGIEQLSTWMYASLGEILRGWGKNVWTAGRYVVPAPLRPFARLLAPLPPLVGAAPLLALVAGLAGVVPAWWTAFGAWSYALGTLPLGFVYRHSRIPVGYVALYPVGSAIAACIYAWASLRGDRSDWKGRTYRAA